MPLLYEDLKRSALEWRKGGYACGDHPPWTNEISPAVRDNADQVVEWNTNRIVSAIRELT